MPHASQQQLDAATEYHRRMIADGYRYDWQRGCWMEPPPPPPAPVETREPDDHRGESAEDFELFLTELKLTAERPAPSKFAHNNNCALVQLSAVRKEREILKWRERELVAKAGEERTGDFHQRVSRIQSALITNEDDND